MGGLRCGFKVEVRVGCSSGLGCCSQGESWDGSGKELAKLLSPHKDSTRMCMFDLIDVSESRDDFLKRRAVREDD